jgi:hypothetical protein
MQPSIPAKKFANITPSVITAGGNALQLIGLILTQATRVPIGQVLSFPSASAVGAYFGLSSAEFAWAQVYFAGNDNSQTKPAALKFAQYPETAVSGYQRGGNIGANGLPALQALSGTLTIATDGVSHTSGSISLAAATSFSNAATIINTALATATIPAVCSYDAVSGGFVFTSPTTGAASSVSITGGTLAAPLYCTVATGLVTSPGAAAAAPSAFMTTLVGYDANWASFSTLWEPVDSEALLFAGWTNSQVDQFAMVLWDTSTVPTQGGDVTSIGYQIKTLAYNGVVVLWEPSDEYLAPFVMGLGASVDYTQQNGRASFAYKFQGGLVPGVTDATTAANLEASGYNYYCAAATRNQPYDFFYPGTISGVFKWADSYFGQMWLNSALQDAIMQLFTNVRRIPYNAQGYALVAAALNDPITNALNAGVITAGVTLSAAQAAEVNQAAGAPIDTTLSVRGWYLQVKDPGAVVRAARGSPICNLWYMDGQSVQTINLNSVNVQ